MAGPVSVPAADPAVEGAGEPADGFGADEGDVVGRGGGGAWLGLGALSKPGGSSDSGALAKAKAEDTAKAAPIKKWKRFTLPTPERERVR